MSKPTIYMHHGYLVTATERMRELYPDATLYVRLTDHEAAMREYRQATHAMAKSVGAKLASDHEAAMKQERQIGFAAAFDVLTFRSANTDNDVLAEELDDLAHDLLESAPDWKDRWKQIHKMNEERAADKARIAALSEALQACLEVEERPEIVAMARKALAQQGKEGET